MDRPARPAALLDAHQEWLDANAFRPASLLRAEPVAKAPRKRSGTRSQGAAAAGSSLSPAELRQRREAARGRRKRALIGGAILGAAYVVGGQSRARQGRLAAAQAEYGTARARAAEAAELNRRGSPSRRRQRMADKLENERAKAEYKAERAKLKDAQRQQRGPRNGQRAERQVNRELRRGGRAETGPLARLRGMVAGGGEGRASTGRVKVGDRTSSTRAGGRQQRPQRPGLLERLNAVTQRREARTPQEQARARFDERNARAITRAQPPGPRRKRNQGTKAERAAARARFEQRNKRALRGKSNRRFGRKKKRRR